MGIARLRVVVSIAGLLAVSGCVSRPSPSELAAPAPAQRMPPSSRGDAASAEDAFPTLARLARAQRVMPDRRSASLPPPPGLDPALLISASPEVLGVSLDSELVRLAALAPALTRPALESIDEARRSEALRRYAAGRQSLLDGRTGEAVLMLREVTRLDPSSAAPWRELGEALLAGGSRIEAIESLRQSVARGEGSPRVLELLGRAAAERGDHAEASAWLARAALADPAGFDPLLEQIVLVGLSRSLRERGETALAAAALRRGLESGASLFNSTRYVREGGEIFRRRGDLWRQVGDDEYRLGAFAAAADAYERSRDLPRTDPSPLEPRLVAALLRAGRPAEAALGVLDRLPARGGLMGSADLSLLRHIAQASGLRRAIADDIEAYRRTLPAVLSPSVSASLALASAAALPRAEARERLAMALAADPGNSRLARGWAGTLPADVPTMSSLAVELVRSRPDVGPVVAASLLEGTIEATALLSALERAEGAGGSGVDRVQTRAAARLLRAEVLAARGLLGPAREAVAPFVASTSMTRGIVLEAELAAAIGDEPMDPPPKLLATAQGRRAAARVLALRQRAAAALEAIRPLIEEPPADATPRDRLSDLLAAAELSALVGDGAAAETLAWRANGIDPADDRPVAILLTIHGPGGVAADALKLERAVRLLRSTLADSRTARLLRAREALRRALLLQAESDSLSLAEEDAGDAAALSTLFTAWQRLHAVHGAELSARAQRWIEPRLAARPGSAALLAGLLQMAGTEAELAAAEARLRAALGLGAGQDVSRLLERLLREQLARPSEADALAEARLTRSGASVERAFEFAELRARQGRDVEAAEVLVAAAGPGVTLLGSQQVQLLALAARLARTSVEADSLRPAPEELPAGARAALRLLDVATDRRLAFSLELHQARLTLLAADRSADGASMRRAVDLAAAQHPELAQRAATGLSTALMLVGRGPLALEVIADAARSRPGDVAVATEWFRIAAMAGDAASVGAMIETLGGEGDVLRRVVMGFADPDEPIRSPKAEAAYIIGTYFSGQKRQHEAEQLYELALRHDPEHAWAANNLGYSLVERGVELERAGELLELAHRLRPDEAAITDSLGWLRYKQAILHDEVDADGRVVRQGAVSLLVEAAATPHGRGDMTILDHAGDALWLVGRRAEAVDHWSRALAEARRLLDLEEMASRPRGNDRGDQPRPSPAIVAEAREILASTASKIEGATHGREVRVAPQIGRPEPQPPAAPGAKPEPQPPMTPARSGDGAGGD